jgi:hypothetical protein
MTNHPNRSRHGVTKRPPVLVPAASFDEIMSLSKAALADIAWSFAARCSTSCDDPEAVRQEFERERDIVLGHRR